MSSVPDTRVKDNLAEASISDPVVIIGGGVGGLVAALDLARSGQEVTVLDRAGAVGGKMREVEVGGRKVDAGPTVFTMRWVFESLFADAGEALADHLKLRPAEVLARHAWADGSRLDLFADATRSAEAIGDLAGAAEARGFLAFCAQARRTYETLERPFIRGPLPTPLSLARDIRDPAALLAIKPFQSMWSALGQHMRDPRLRQLFGRYATYCGSSPFLAPATLMLVAHVEQQGVWMVEGGMHRIAVVLAELAGARGTKIRTSAEVAEITVAAGRACGVRLSSGEHIVARAVVANADPAAIAGGLFGAAARAAVPAMPPERRSLSAVTWAMTAETRGFPLVRHNVFFSGDYRREFELLARGRLPDQPTIYVCAQDRDDSGAHAGGPERLLCLVNAPALGDSHAFTDEEIHRCTNQSFNVFGQCGLGVFPKDVTVTTPSGFEKLFPGTGGALYGPAVHGAMATFRRPGSRTRLPGLYLAGGSTHPGAGVPMAALSGRLAASALMADLGSTARSGKTDMFGGTSTH